MPKRIFHIVLICLFFVGCKGKGPTKKAEQAQPVPTVTYNSVRLI